MTYDPNDREKPSESRMPANDTHRGNVEGWFIANEAGPACWQQQHRTGEPRASQGWLSPCRHAGDAQNRAEVNRALDWASEMLF